MRGIGTALQIFLLAALSGCAGDAGQRSVPTPEVTNWQSKIGQNHALAGRIWEPATKSFIDRAVLLPRLRSATYIFLGEKHDNEDHHRLQAWIVENLVSGGRRPAIAMEMLDADQAAALSGYLSAHPTDAGGIGTAVGWDQKGWPAWPIYAPIVQPALNVGAPLLPANLSRSTIKSVARSGAGANDVKMSDLSEGRFCGMCHNNEVAWGLENCDLCHSAKPGLKSGIYGGDKTTGPGKW